MMFQNYALFPHLNVIDNVAFSLTMKGTDAATRKARAQELLDLVDMTQFADRLPPATCRRWTSPGSPITTRSWASSNPAS